MNRRTVLKIATMSLSGGLAGCTSFASSIRATEKMPCSTTAPQYMRVGIASDDSLKITCTRSSDTEDTETTLLPKPSSANLPLAEITFTLTNRHTLFYNTNYYRWAIQKQVDDEWYTTSNILIPGSSGSSLRPAGTHTWSFTIDNTNLNQMIEPSKGRDSATVRAHGPGRYAFSVIGSFGKEGQSWIDGSPIEVFTTPFTLEGKSLELQPENRVRIKSGENSSRVILRYTDEGKEHYTYTVTRIKEPSKDQTPRRLITEQIYTTSALRNTLAYFDDNVKEVQLHTHMYQEALRDQIIEYEGDFFSITFSRL
jgi:hypothetical protein